MGKIIQFNEIKQQKEKENAIDNLLKAIFAPIPNLNDETTYKNNEQKTVIFTDEETKLIDKLNNKIEEIINNTPKVEMISIYFASADFMLGCFIGNTMKPYNVGIEIMFYDPDQLDKKSNTPTSKHKYIYFEDLKNEVKGDDK